MDKNGRIEKQECFHCRQKIAVNHEGYLERHLRNGERCPGAQFSASQMSRDLEFLDMMRKLKGK